MLKKTLESIFFDRRKPQEQNEVLKEEMMIIMGKFNLETV